MTAIEYFQQKVDPFEMQKELGLTSSLSSIATLAERVNDSIAIASQKPRDQLLDDFKGFVLTALWGNRMDLSLWPVGGGDNTDSKSTLSRTADAFASVINAGQKMILANDIDALAHYVAGRNAPSRMDIIVDNAGFELFCDLCLADFLVSTKLVGAAHIQLKAHPTFVSDAMAKDVAFTIDFLRRGNGDPSKPSPVAQLGNRWASHVETGRWQLVENFFWVQPTAMWDMPPATANDLGTSSLVFIKGDANYRRLLGDRDWPLGTPFSDVACYFPAPVCALRTLKAELGCGMPERECQRAAQEDHRWLVAGKYGVVQFLDTRALGDE